MTHFKLFFCCFGAWPHLPLTFVARRCSGHSPRASNLLPTAAAAAAAKRLADVDADADVDLFMALLRGRLRIR